ncbi:GntR family transcriptional regulator [Arsenicicoccus sp. oral taxon 190]|uniref:GntR family transcriptional regulator n=1 Tax=Arsenicicoccus sp. oral taxon 190 TaxID=1658671 RepID=UPI00067A1CDD|nr:GntR family transcriptional regulator [Arsenicicoccus sp. oral taxon 190]AKT50997.1 hypothetical protein ADJ73_06110 [Arsenicicoccus sp. oral taxon 190]
MAGIAVEAALHALRAEIFEGHLRPGDHLDEVGLGRRLGVSRNTLREAFRVLAEERLVEHRPHRGVFVRALTVPEARAVYQARRVIECGAVREAAVRLATTRMPPQAAVERVRAGVTAGREAAAAEDWRAVGSANSAFHLAMVALADNPVLDRAMRQVLTEMRLLFVVVGPAREVHEHYVEHNEQLARLVEAGELVRVAVALEDYLLQAEEHLVGEFARAVPAAGAEAPRAAAAG